jgi:hypothetical protein
LNIAPFIYSYRYIMKMHITILSALLSTCSVSAIKSPPDFPPDHYTVVASRAAAQITRGFPQTDTPLEQLAPHNDPVVSRMVYECNVLRWHDIAMGNPNLSSPTTALADLETHNDPVVSCMVYGFNIVHWDDIAVETPNVSPRTTAQSYELLPGCVVPTQHDSQRN